MNKIKLSTEIKIKELSQQYEFDTKLAGIGSCFAQNILNKLSHFGLRISQNPSGIIYNAISIENIMERIANNKLLIKEELFKHNDLWHSWEHHGDFSFSDIDKALKTANSAICEFRKSVENCDIFILTPSSSVVYKYIESQKIVANCHKVPNKEFEQNILSMEENLISLNNTIDLIRKINSNCLIIFTLSPVRHYPGNLILNAQSKANLLGAISAVSASKNIDYFPSYEILLDELRDYRFYKEDMLHPNELAQKIILSKFLKKYFAPKAILKMKENEKIYKNSLHKNIK